MPFLTRWDDDQSRPAVTSALRDLAVRAVLPAVALFGVIVAFGYVLKGPLFELSEEEKEVNRDLQASRDGLWNTITDVMSTIGNTEYVIGVCLIVVGLVWWRTKQWWYAVVPGIAISLQASVFVAATHVVGRARPTVEPLDPTPPTSSTSPSASEATAFPRSREITWLLLPEPQAGVRARGRSRPRAHRPRGSASGPQPSRESP